jgi:hypothetical protein
MVTQILIPILAADESVVAVATTPLGSTEPNGSDQLDQLERLRGRWRSTPNVLQHRGVRESVRASAGKPVHAQSLLATPPWAFDLRVCRHSYL